MEKEIPDIPEENTAPFPEEKETGETAGEEVRTGTDEASGDALPEDAEEKLDGEEKGPLDAEEEISGEKKGKIRRRILIISAVILSAALVIFAAGFLIVNLSAKDITCEVGDEPDFSYYREGFAGAVCSLNENEISKLASDKIDTRDFYVTYFGFVNKRIKIFFVDTTPPEMELRTLSVASDIEVFPEDFVKSSYDLSEVKFEFEKEADTLTPGEYTVGITATDEGGNVTKGETALFVGMDNMYLEIELGTDIEKIESELEENIPELTGYDPSEINTEKCGKYPVFGSDENDNMYKFIVEIKDTTPPLGNVHSFDILKGGSFDRESLVSDISDLSEVRVTFGGKVDTMKTGKQKVMVFLTDEFENSTALKAYVYVHEFHNDSPFEAGMSTGEFFSSLTGDDEGLTLPEDFSSANVRIGTNTLTLIGAYNELECEVVFEDTTPPVLELREVIVYKDHEVSLDDFIESCSDFSEVKFFTDDELSTEKAGNHELTVNAEDIYGNRTSRKTTLIVLEDKTPPVIYGITNKIYNIGGTKPSFSDVYGEDDVDGRLDVVIDESDVDYKVTGVYTVGFSCTDNSGNTTRAEAFITIYDDPYTLLNTYVDNLLSQIVTPEMNQRQKAYAIYTWASRNIKYSSSSTYLMGNYLAGATYGLRTRSGNCYIYYAVCDALLERCGISSLEISRNIPDQPHYWNLVFVDGAWYHFDACPHYVNFPIESFLLTDSEVAEYSGRCTNYYSFDTWKYPRTP